MTGRSRNSESEKKEEVKEEVIPMEVGKEAEIQAKLEQVEAEKAKYDQELREMRFERNKNVLSNILCDDCGSQLPIVLTEVMTQGLSTMDVTCPECENITRLTIHFEGTPYDVDPRIKQESRGKAYDIKPIPDLTLEQLAKRVRKEAEMVVVGRNKVDPRTQLLLRAVDLLMNEK
jgi:phage FluMu protein Com